MKFYDVGENEWVMPRRKGYKFACCDCGLVHDMDFRIVKGRIQFRARRNNRSTAVMRRHLKSKATPTKNATGEDG